MPWNANKTTTARLITNQTEQTSPQASHTHTHTRQKTTPTIERIKTSSQTAVHLHLPCCAGPAPDLKQSSHCADYPNKSKALGPKPINNQNSSNKFTWYRYGYDAMATTCSSQNPYLQVIERTHVRHFRFFFHLRLLDSYKAGHRSFTWTRY